MSGGKIFISYRRGLDNDSAGRLYDRIAHVYGDDRVFRDVDASADMLGLDFHQVITERVSDCSAFVAVIGRGWLDQLERLHDPDDFVRIEIETAVARDDIRVIPVLIGDAAFPDQASLPTPLQPLLRRGGLKLQNEGYAGAVKILIDVLAQATEAEAPAGADREPGAQTFIAKDTGTDTGPSSRPGTAPAGAAARSATDDAVPDAAHDPLPRPAAGTSREAQEAGAPLPPAPAPERLHQPAVGGEPAPERRRASAGTRRTRLVSAGSAGAAVCIGLLYVSAIGAGALMNQRSTEMVERLDRLHPADSVEIARSAWAAPPPPPPPPPGAAPAD